MSNNFQLSIISKCLAKHISNKVSLKSTISETHVYIDIRWPWIWKQYFYLGIWNDDPTKIMVLPSFQIAKPLNSPNRYESGVINELWPINFYMNIGISNWNNWSFGPRKMKFFTLFQFLTWLLISYHLKLFSTYLVRRNGAMWRTCFSAPQYAKLENQLKHINQVRNEINWLLGLRVWRIILVIRGWAHITQSFTLISIKSLRI